jgi:hypothetical protein
MTKQAELNAYVFDGLAQQGNGALAAVLLGWMEASPRFTGFVETYRDKIRKKIRVTRDEESMLDVRAELEVAYRLLNDRRLTVAYEPYASAKRRGPDFSLTFRTNLAFNLEVARMRVEEGDVALETLRARKEERVLRIVLDKLEQMQPGMANLLLLHTRQSVAQVIDLERLLQGVKTRVESKDAAFYALSRYSSPADFYKEFLRLSGIVLWGEGLVKVWVNKQARPGLEEKVVRVIGTAGE